jgi:hypothetical protein
MIKLANVANPKLLKGGLMPTSTIVPLCDRYLPKIWGYIDSLFNLGWLFIVVALGLAILTTFVTLWKSIGSERREIKGAASSFLESLKGVIEALANAPSWFAVFLSGCALIWLATSVMPNMCEIQMQPPPTAS